MAKKITGKLTGEQIEKIAVDVMGGHPPRAEGPEVDKLVASLKKDIKKAERDNVGLVIPDSY